MCQVWCSGIQGIYAQLMGAFCHGYMYIVPYMYTSAMRCAKCGVAVLHASLLNWGVSLPWALVHCAIYETYLV